MQTGFQCNPGKQGKYFQKHLSVKEWEMLLQTYADADFERNWAALFTMADLFRSIALQVVERFALEYPNEEYQRAHIYIQDIRNLPKNKKEGDGA